MCDYHRKTKIIDLPVPTVAFTHAHQECRHWSFTATYTEHTQHGAMFHLSHSIQLITFCALCLSAGGLSFCTTNILLAYLYTWQSNKNRTPKRTLVFQLSLTKTNLIVTCQKSKSISSVWVNFIICIFNMWIHITRFVKPLKFNKNTMYVMQVVYTNYAVHVRRKMFC